MNILEALDDPNLLGASIRDAESWKPWKGLLAAAFGLPLDPYQAELFRPCTGRRVPPGAPVAYLWLCIGRRGGKSFAMALIAVFLAVFRDWRKYLSPGERAIVLLVAADREQAKILHRYCQGILSPPILQSSVLNVTASEIELKGGVTIEVVTRSYRTVRGRSVCVAVLDELAFWRDDDSANPDSEVLNAVRASMATFGGDAMVIAGSSPYARRGVLWDAFRRWFGKDDARNLVWRAATRVMNPTVPQEFVDAEYERDAASANAEYGAEFRSDVAEFVSIEVLEACTADGVFELPPISGASYVAFVDPSGGSSDSMTLAIAHSDKFGTGILDCIRECRPPFSPESVVDEFCSTLKKYHISKVCGDRYAGEWPRERFRMCGVTYELSEKPKSDIYRDVLPLLNSRKVQLLDDRRLISQLHGLQRRTARGGKDSIDHAPGAKDDVANSVAGALLLAVAVKPMIISDAVLAWSAQPAAMQCTLHTIEGRFQLMSRQLPYLAMDGVLCDRPQDGCFIGGKRNYARDNISNKETAKMTRTLSADQLTRYVGIRVRNPAAADRYWARCAGTAQDGAMDDETVEKLKGFLKNKLSAEDHEQVCNMLAGDVEAEDTEPPPGDPDAEPQGKLASDAARADFNRRFPDAAKINIDSSGIQPRKRASSYSAAGAKSFAEMFPDADEDRVALMRDLKPLPDRDPARATLAAAIALEAGARRDLKVAEDAAELAAERCWRAQSALDELRKVVAAPSGALADEFISSVGAGNPCGTAILERSGIESRAKLVAAEGEAAVWDETRKECEIAVRSKEAATVTAKERVERCARAVVCNAETAKRLGDDLEALQADVVSARSVLRFVWGKGVNGELSVPLQERIERLLWRDLIGLESTSASAAWSAAFDELLTNSEAELPI